MKEKPLKFETSKEISSRKHRREEKNLGDDRNVSNKEKKSNNILSHLQKKKIEIFLIIEISLANNNRNIDYYN